MRSKQETGWIWIEYKRPGTPHSRPSRRDIFELTAEDNGWPSADDELINEEQSVRSFKSCVADSRAQNSAKVTPTRGPTQAHIRHVRLIVWLWRTT